MKNVTQTLAVAVFFALLLSASCQKSTNPDPGPGGGGGGGGTPRPDLNGDWTARSSGTGQDLVDVAASDSLFCAISDSGTILFSSDGITWSSSYTGALQLYRVIWTGDRFVAVGRQGGVGSGAWIVTIVPNGTRTEQAVGTNSLSARDITVTNVGRLLVAAGSAAGSTLLWSWDGIEWAMSAVEGASITEVWGTPVGNFASGYIGSYYKNCRIAGMTPDTSALVPLFGDAAVWTGSQLFTGSNYTTTDGTTWLQRPAAPLSIRALLWDDSLIVAAGSNGLVGWSSDAASWQSKNVGVTNRLNGIAYAKGRYVVVGTKGAILTRP